MNVTNKPLGGHLTMTEKVDFRYSDVDFVSYLLTLGYEYTDIEIIRDNRTNKLKGFVHFNENKLDLINIFEQYQNENVSANVIKLKNNRKKITKLIKAEILKYQASKM
jgi:hypothetical protein